jgi:long-chain acyl-CoA synthetase
VNVGETLRTTAARLPDKKAVILGSKSISFKQLDEGADRVAGFLFARGIRKGDRVGIVFPNIPEFVTVYFGIIRLGAIGVPLDSRLKGEELSSILRDAEAKAVFLTDTKAREVYADLGDGKNLVCVVVGGEESPGTCSLETILRKEESKRLNEAEIDENDEALHLYTSGTTGSSKGVVLTFRNLDYFPLTMNRVVKAGKDDVIGFILPLSHISGPIVSNLIALNGSTMVLFEHLRPDRILEEIDLKGVTYFLGVPPIFQSLLRVPRRDRYHLKSLRYVSMMGTNVPVQLMKEFRETFPTVKAIQGYGLTETSPYITLLPVEYADSKMGSIGLPVPDIQIKLIAVNGEEVAQGGVGEIAVKGPMVMKGYHNDPEATKEMIREGWLFTGDLGRLDDEGFVYHLGRRDDLIITGGLNVFPAEVENVLARHPDILEAGVVGVPDEDRGHLIKAAVVLRPDKTTDKKEIMAFCREHLAGFKVPKLIEFKDALPKTPTGKVSRRDLL